MAEQDKFFESTIAGKRAVVLRQNVDQYKKIYEQETAIYLTELNKRKTAEEQTERELDRAKKTRNSQEIARLQKQLNAETKARKDAEDEFEKYKKTADQNAALRAQKFEEQRFKNMSLFERREYSKNIAQQLKLQQESDTARLESIKKRLKAQGKSDEDISNNKDVQDLESSIAQTAAQHKSAQELSTKFNWRDITSSKNRSALFANRTEAAEERFAAAKENYTNKKAAADAAQQKFNDKFKEKELKWQERINAAKAAGNRAELEAIETERRNEIEASEEYQELRAARLEEDKAAEETKSALVKKSLLQMSSNLNNAFSNVLDKATDSKEIDKILDDLFGNRAKYIARLDGSSTDWQDSFDNVSDSIGFSGIVRKRDVLDEMERLVDSGVAYNLELRAFLAETSDKIASTFDAFDANLLRIIRIQQADTTAARLGMEASLTRLFNEYFEDSSYMNKNGVSDNVTQAILDSSAALDKNSSLEYEFTVQKWLGSLYSMGMDSGAVQKIATGLNYLGTGNVSALNGDSSLQTLFSMSASRAGKSYASLLTGGLNAEDTNDLLKAMIEYLAEIADSQTNMVQKSAYAELFGMSVTDLSTFAKLTTTDIANLHANTTSYQELMNETEYQLSQISKRTNISTLMNNMIDNVLVGVASGIGSNAATYGIWQALGLVKEYVGKIEIPGILGFGTGISSGIDIVNVAQTGMMGMSLVGSIISAISSLAKGGPSSLNAWDYDEFTARGQGLNVLRSGSSDSTSYSATLGVGSASGEDVEAVSLQSAKDTAAESSGTTSEEMEKSKEIPQQILEALNGTESTSVIGLLTDINNRLDPQRVFYTAIAGVLSNDAVLRATNLQSQLSAAAITSEVDSQDTSRELPSLVGRLSENSNEHVNITPEMLSLIINDAIQQALQTYLFANNIPVTIQGGTPV